MKPSDLWPEEFYDVDKILKMGAVKYAPRDWEHPEGRAVNHVDNCRSIARHLAKTAVGIEADTESNEPHELHIMCRAGMAYTRKKRGIMDTYQGDPLDMIDILIKELCVFKAKLRTKLDKGYDDE